MKGCLEIMEKTIKEIADRIRGLRELMEITPEEMAEITDVKIEEYLKLENGELDFSFTFIYKCAERFGIDMIDILKGTSPKLSSYSIIRKNDGLPISRREGFTYLHKAPFFKNKAAEPFYVRAPYSKEAEIGEIHLNSHEGQEIDIVLKGSLKIRVADNVEMLYEGDIIYYDSGQGHGMVATGGEDCEFLAIVLKKR